MGTCFSETKASEENKKTTISKDEKRDQKAYESHTELNPEFLQ